MNVLGGILGGHTAHLFSTLSAENDLATLSGENEFSTLSAENELPSMPNKRTGTLILNWFEF